jgi:hypothetical protein
MLLKHKSNQRKIKLRGSRMLIEWRLNTNTLAFNVPTSVDIGVGVVVGSPGPEGVSVKS